jgi:DNA-binding CsgD family transcriptional regulator
MSDRASELPIVWLLLAPDACPDAWLRRAVPVMRVPLRPDEAAAVLDERPRPPSLASDEELARLLSRGLSTLQISLALGISPRTVFRRVARLRRDFGASSTKELVSLLARYGLE